MASGRGRFALPPPKWRQSGQEPDYRFSLANERTFLAWIRSALAMMAGGVVPVQFATQWSPRWLVAWTGLGLTALAGLMSVLAYRQWRANEIAMRHARPLPSSVAGARGDGGGNARRFGLASPQAVASRGGSVGARCCAGDPRVGHRRVRCRGAVGDLPGHGPWQHWPFA